MSIHELQQRVLDNAPLATVARAMGVSGQTAAQKCRELGLELTKHANGRVTVRLAGDGGKA